MAAGSKGFSNRSGQVWASHFGWSGNHEQYLDSLADGRRMLGATELLGSGQVVVQPGGTYRTPSLYAAYSDRGLEGVTEAFYDWFRARPHHVGTTGACGRSCSTPGKRSTSTTASRRSWNSHSPLGAQHILDLANPEAWQYIYDRIAALLKENNIAYLKWDQNQDLAEHGHAGRPSVHEQTTAAYRLFDALKGAFPDVEIESCSSGGARVDLGILQRTDVSDPAQAHVAAAQALEAVYNLGSGTGVSVRQIMDMVAKVTGIDFAPAVHPRRPGDPARIVANGDLAKRDLEAMVASAYHAVTGVRAQRIS